MRHACQTASAKILPAANNLIHDIYKVNTVNCIDSTQFGFTKGFFSYTVQARFVINNHSQVVRFSNTRGFVIPERNTARFVRVMFRICQLFRVNSEKIGIRRQYTR